MTLELAGLLGRVTPIVEALQRGLGRDMVVWGAKSDGERLFWELYVYDPEKQEPNATVAGLKELLAPHLRIAPLVRESVPYMMVSFDIDEQTLDAGEVRELNLYLTGVDEHAGRSYVVREGSMELANTYRFLRPKLDVDSVLGLVESSTFVDYSDPRTLARVVIPELFACKRVCVAKKRKKDGVYYSGIDVDQLVFFLNRFAYPRELIELASLYADQLDHLYFDVGVDYEQDASGAIHYPKTSFYGTF